MLKIIKNKKIAIFDIDGTIFRSSLIIELTETLVKYGIFPPIAEKEIERNFVLWKNRKGSYENYINKVVEVYSRRIKRCAKKDIMEATRLVIKEQKNAVYVYTRELVKKLRRENFIVLAISGSPEEIVGIFCRGWKFDKYFGTIFETKNGYYTGEVTALPVRNKKETLLKYARDNKISLRGSIGVGDTESDVSFLEEVARPICFNPNLNLYRIAKKRGWPVVVERKNVIYKI